MELKILYDNEAKEGFKSGWGFSCLVGERLLFDTGADVNTLLYNMHKLAVKFEYIDKIVLSHEHGDHVGGLQIVWELGKVVIFAPKSFSNSFKRRLASYPNVNLNEVSKAEEVCSGIFTTGELGGFFLKEQSLVVKTGNGLTVITGCSHPGLEKIIQVASRFGVVYGVVGGFHGFSRLEALKRLDLVIPCHCTTRKREILSIYPETSMNCSAGSRIEV